MIDKWYFKKNRICGP